MTEPARGPRGYPDYQHVENWDGPQLLKKQEYENSKGGSTKSVVFECSRYGYMSIRAEALIGLTGVVVNYFTEAAAVTVIGSRSIILNTGVGTSANVRMPNLGPWMDLETIGGTEPSKVAIWMQATNRTPNRECVPTTDALLFDSSAYAGKETKNFPIAPVVSGTVRLSIISSVANSAEANLYAVNFAGTEERLMQVTVAEKVGSGSGECPVPMRGLLVTVTAVLPQEIQTSLVVTP